MLSEEPAGKHDKALVFNITGITDIVNCKMVINKKVVIKLSATCIFFTDRGFQFFYTMILRAVMLL